MTDKWPRILKDNGLLQYIRGDTGNYTPVGPPPPASRSSLVYGTYTPVGPTNGDYSQATCGIYGPSTLTTDSSGGAITFSTNGQTISNTDFYRRVSITGQNITFNNCRFWGSDTENQPLVLASNSNALNITFIDCTFSAMAPQYKTSAAKGFVGKVTFRRCDVFNCVDGFFIHPGTAAAPATTIIEGSYFHDMAYLSPDPDAAGGIDDNASHVDVGCQFEGGHLTLDGNNFQGFCSGWDIVRPPVNITNAQTGEVYHLSGNKYYPTPQSTSCIMFSPDLQPLGNINIQRNIFDGSSVCLNVNPNYTTATSFVFSNNKCGKNHRPGHVYAGTNVTLTANVTLRNFMTVTGNTDLETGAPLTKDQCTKNG